MLTVRAKEGKRKEASVLQSLNEMTQQTKERMCRLFDIAYTIAYKELSFTLCPTLIAIEEKHGVHMGTAYNNNKACRSFIGHIAGVMRDDMQRQFLLLTAFRWELW